MKKRAKECIFTILSAFPGEWKANRKVASYLDSMTFHRPSMLASSFSFHSAFLLSLFHNSQDTSRHSFHKCNKRYREKRKERGREREALEWTPRENSMFFRWRSIITRARTGSISGYFKLLTRRDIPERAETSSWLSSGKFRTTDRKLIRRARIKTKAECWRQWTRRSETVESTRCTRRIEPLFSSGVLWNRTLGDTAVKCCFK